MTAHAAESTMKRTITEEKVSRLVLNMARVALLAICATMLVAVLHPDVRAQLRNSFAKDYRNVVSVAEGNLTGGVQKFKVAKVKTRSGLWLEIYQLNGDGSQNLKERIQMPDSRDAYFNFNGQPTNLAIDDIDGDGRAEILAPSFDQNLVGRLNIYHYDEVHGITTRALR